MRIYQYLFLLNFFLLYGFCQKGINLSYINNNDITIKNAVYLIKSRDGELLLELNDFASFKNEEKNKLKNYFSLINDYHNNNNTEKFFYIKNNLLGLKLSSSNENNKIIKYTENLDKDYALWKVIPKINEENQLIYYIQNKKTKKYWYFESSKNNKELKLKEMKQLNKNNEFKFIELYKEFESKESELLKKEPIDILIIFGQNLKINEISLKMKEEKNQKLVYLIKIILHNIPWIRKLFILLPNYLIKYFNYTEEFKEKKVYIKNKDLLDFTSLFFNSLVNNIFKMRNFGLSENFIFIDDEYFISQPLNKSNFFYEENNTIVPLLITNNFDEINKEKIESQLYKYYLNKNKNKHSQLPFDIIKKRTLLFMYKIFGNDDIRYGKKLIQLNFRHNVIPINIGDIQEIYNCINKYNEYSNNTLFFSLNNKYDLDLQTFYMTYVKNKYDRKVPKISSYFYDLGDLKNTKKISENIFSKNVFNKRINKTKNIKRKRILNELFKDKNKNIYINKNKDIIKRYNHIPLIKLNEINDIKDINETILNKVKKMNKDISISFNEINNLINKMGNIINKTLKYKYVENNDTINKDILINEINYLNKLYKRQKAINICIICLILLLIINKICTYYIYIKRNQDAYTYKKGKRKKVKYKYKYWD